MNWRFFDLEYLSASLVIGALVLTLFLTNFGHANADEATSGPKASPCGEAAWNPKFPEFPDLDLDKDTDEDGLTDWDEICGFDIQVGVIISHVFTDHVLPDTDKDGLTDREELVGRGPNFKSEDIWQTDPTNFDTDGDGVSDGGEFEPYMILLDGGYGARQITRFSDPTKADTDDDGLDDKIEREGWLITVNGEPRQVRHSSPQDSDTDKDGLTDKEEYDGLDFPSSFWGTVKTDPTRVDTDGDGIPDKDEYTGEVKPGKWIKLDPTRVDTDGDGLQDRIELESVYCDPVRADTDGDGKADGLTGKQCGTEDRDLDGLSDRLEEALGLDPESPDTDGDGLSDWEEIKGSTHPNKADTDGDGEGDKTDKDPNATDDKSKGLKARNEELTATLGKRDQTIKDNQKKIGELTRQNESLPVPQDNGNLKVPQDNGNLKATASPSAKAEAPVKQDTGSESNILIDWMPVVIAAVVALILGAVIGRFIMNRPAAPGARLSEPPEVTFANYPRLRDDALDDPDLVNEFDAKITNRLNEERADGLQEKREVVRARLNNTRTELRGAVAATNRGIPDAMLQEAEDRISSTSGDNNTQAENIEVASSLIRNVDRYYLGHNPAI